LRSLLSKVLNATYRRILSLPYNDLSSGYRMYRRDVVRNLKLVSRDFDVLEEILVRTYADGWRIKEIPFRYMARGSGNSHARLIKFGWALLRTLFRMWRLRNSIASADYDYRAFDSPIWLQRYWQRSRHRIIMDFLCGCTTDVLDVGCGSSRIIVDLASAVGMDILQNKLRWLRPVHQRLVRGACQQLPFASESFSAVIHSEVIEHIPDTPDILSEIWRVLRPGGVVILGTPDYSRKTWLLLEWLYGKVHPGGYAEEHITHFTYKTLRQRLMESGFSVLDCQYVGFSEMIFKAQKHS